MALNFSKYTILLATGENQMHHHLLCELEGLSEKNKFKLTFATLQAGDLIICHNEDNEYTNATMRENLGIVGEDNDPHLRPLLMIERKRISDYCSSFKSGHYTNQKNRMIAFSKQTGCKNHLVVEGYLEGKTRYKTKVCNVPVPTLDQCFTSIGVRDHFNVIHVRDEAEHAKYLLRCLKTLEKYKLYENELEYDREYVSNLKMKKKSNLTPDVYYQRMIGGLPAYSMDMAQKIYEVHPTLTQLIEELLENGTKNVQEIKVGKNKLGKVRAGRLIEYLLNDGQKADLKIKKKC
jgi:ERCC4-type nuclease